MVRTRSRSWSPWEHLLEDQVGWEQMDYGLALAWASILLFSSPTPDQPVHLTEVSSRKKQALLFETKLQNLLISFMEKTKEKDAFDDEKKGVMILKIETRYCENCCGCEIEKSET